MFVFVIDFKVSGNDNLIENFSERGEEVKIVLPDFTRYGIKS